MTINSYKDLVVWQKSFELCLIIYRLTKNFPREELYGIVSQMRRAALSIPSNIAEGFSRHRKLEYIQFLHIAFGSAAELETQLQVSKELNYIKPEDFTRAEQLLTEVNKMLNSLVANVKTWNS